jgi:DNA-binding FadR family transcriptional regulator
VVNKTTAFYEHHRLADGELPVVHAVHVALLDTFRAGDEGAAVTALSQHILNGEFNREVHRRWRGARTRQR